MSYILDALQRAQAERSRGQVPDLQTPAVGASGAAAGPDAPPRRDGLWLGLLLALVLLAGLAWWLWLRPGAALAPVVAATPAIPEAAPGVQPEPAPPVIAAPPVRVTVLPEPKASAPEPSVALAPPAQSEAAARAAEGTVFTQEQLPAAVRAQLPTLQIAGLTYSGNPAHRMVIVNGQVLREGDQAAPGLLLQRIEPQRTVWAFQGYRYALPAQ